MINSNWHHTVSEVSQLTVQILDTAFLTHSLGLKDHVRCSSWDHWKARSGLPLSVNWFFFARCYGWGATGENRSKIVDFAPTRSLWDKISSGKGRPAPIIFARLVRPMYALQSCRWQFSEEKNFVADFLRAKCDFRQKSAVMWFWAHLGDLGRRGGPPPTILFVRKQG